MCQRLSSDMSENDLQHVGDCLMHWKVPLLPSIQWDNDKLLQID